MRPIDRVLERLEGVKAHNGYFEAPCPAHDDREPSLSISEGDDGRVLLKCFAGCGLENIVAAIDLKVKDLFADGGRGGRSYSSSNGATVQHPPKKPHGDAENTVADADATPDNSATPGGGAGDDPPHLRLVASEGERVAGCTLDAYAEYVGLPVDFLRGLGLKEIHYIDDKAVKMPYFDAAGSEEVCVRFRVSLTGKPKVKTRRGDKHQLYGLWRLEKARQRGYAILVEGESDAQTGWHHGEPVIGVPGATGFQSEWVAELDGIEKVYAIIEPDQGGEAFWQRLASTELRDRLYRVELVEVKDLRDLHRQDTAGFKDRLSDALRRSRHWLDIAETETQERFREAWAHCADLAQAPDILERFYTTLRESGVAGERRAAMILYLAMTSRRLGRPVSVAVKGPSSGGKSYLLERVLEYFPESAFYALTAMSERVLAYSEEPIKHRFLVLYEAAGMNSDFQTYLIRSLLSEGKLRYETIEKTSEGLKPRMIEREGPTGLIVTTTMDKLHPENETRLLSLSVTDTREQTGEVLRALAEEEVSRPDLTPWTALQEWLEHAEMRVTVPFAKILAEKIPPVAVRLRRDFSAVLNLIRSHAILHQASRKRDDQGRIVATIDDYSVVRDLVAALVAEGVDATVSATVRATVKAVQKLADDEGGDPVSLGPIAEELKLDKSAASRRLRTAIGKGFVKNLEDRKGKPGRYVTGDPIPADVVVLPDPEEVLQCCSVAGGDKTPPPPPSEEDPGMDF
ncbi:MAG: hypothetical protein M3P49_00490 [Actinomycetota bacterium]|nr:hypothetical protein [Actinomycetota bacterium]